MARDRVGDVAIVGVRLPRGMVTTAILTSSCQRARTPVSQILTCAPCGRLNDETGVLFSNFVSGRQAAALAVPGLAKVVSRPAIRLADVIAANHPNLRLAMTLPPINRFIPCFRRQGWPTEGPLGLPSRGCPVTFTYGFVQTGHLSAWRDHWVTTRLSIFGMPGVVSLIPQLMMTSGLMRKHSPSPRVSMAAAPRIFRPRGDQG